LTHILHHPGSDIPSQDYKVMRITHQASLDRLPRTSGTVKPPIQFMEKDVGQQRFA
jgi:hypothetical protein